MLRDALQRRTKADLVHYESALTIDLWPLKDTEYDRLSLERRQRADLGGLPVWVSSPEDVIIAKLCWQKASQSEMQRRDVFHILRLRRDLDWPYLRHWAEHFGVLRLLEQLREEAQSLDGDTDMSSPPPSAPQQRPADDD